MLRDFVHTTYPRLVGALTLVSGSRAAAEDAVQEALARAFERSAREAIDSLPAWVTAVSMNLARSALRRRRAEGRARERLTEVLEIAERDGVADRVDLRRALADLPRRQREAIALHYYLGLDVKEVALAMRSPQGTVKSLLARARRALAAALDVRDLEGVGDHGYA